MRRQRGAAIGLLGVCLVALAGVLGAPPTRVIVVGGSSGMGKALAKAIVARGGSVLLISRSMEKLISAQVCVCVCATAGAHFARTDHDDSHRSHHYHLDAHCPTTTSAAHCPTTTMPASKRCHCHRCSAAKHPTFAPHVILPAAVPANEHQGKHVAHHHHHPHPRPPTPTHAHPHPPTPTHTHPHLPNRRPHPHPPTPPHRWTFSATPRRTLQLSRSRPSIALTRRRFKHLPPRNSSVDHSMASSSPRLAQHRTVTSRRSRPNPSLGSSSPSSGQRTTRASISGRCSPMVAPSLSSRGYSTVGRGSIARRSPLSTAPSKANRREEKPHAPFSPHMVSHPHSFAHVSPDSSLLTLTT